MPTEKDRPDQTLPGRDKPGRAPTSDPDTKPSRPGDRPDDPEVTPPIAEPKRPGGRPEPTPH